MAKLHNGVRADQSRPLGINVLTGKLGTLRSRVIAALAAVALAVGLGIAVTSAALAPAASAATATGPITGYQGLCLDDRSASTANFNPVQVYTCNGTNAQQWTVDTSSNTLQVLGKCLDVNAAGTANETKVDLYDCNGTSAQNPDKSAIRVWELTSLTW